MSIAAKNALYQYPGGHWRFSSLFKVSEVDKQNYGDCKALANYMHSLLKTVDIDSWYCVVQAGREHKESLMSDFTSMNQGNHIILCLPFKNDTTWLECTSQTIPFGFLSDFTDDRNVLACTPEGGKFITYTQIRHRRERWSMRAYRFDIQRMPGIYRDGWKPVLKELSMTTGNG